MNIYLFPDNAAFPRVLFARTALIKLRGDIFVANSLAVWRIGGAPFIKDLFLCHCVE